MAPKGLGEARLRGAASRTSMEMSGGVSTGVDLGCETAFCWGLRPVPEVMVLVSTRLCVVVPVSLYSAIWHASAWREAAGIPDGRHDRYSLLAWFCNDITAAQLVSNYIYTIYTTDRQTTGGFNDEPDDLCCSGFSSLKNVCCFGLILKVPLFKPRTMQSRNTESTQLLQYLQDLMTDLREAKNEK